MWSVECEKVFQQIKKALTSEPILRCPDFTKPYKIQTDASDVAIPAALQEQNGEDLVIANSSRVLSKQERKFRTSEKECLAVLAALEKWKHYILGQGRTP